MSFIKLKTEEIDFKLFATTLLLSLIGILLIYSAKHTSLNEQNLFQKQLFWLFLSLIAAGILFIIPLRFHEIFSYLYYLLAIVLLVTVLFFGISRLGATRWFELKGMTFQPSEWAKIATVFALARYLSYTKRSFSSILWLGTVIVIGFFPLLLVLKQPDLGTSLVFFAIVLSMLYWAKVPLSFIFLIFSPLISLIAGFHWLSWGIFFFILIYLLYWLRPGFLFSFWIIIFNLIFGILTPLLWNRLHDYQKLRVLVFLDPNRDPLGAGYQIIQSKVAIGSGGILGKGFLHGSQTKLAFLPMQHTDFIFSVAGEEFGLIGSLIFLALYFFLVFRGISIASKSRNSFNSYVAFGLTSVFIFQGVVNLGMAMGLLPVTGITFPLVSYGGSSLLMSWVSIGLLLAIHYKWTEY
ncbi:MAG: rod shape-determining protein RodA [candidate division Zixibacteria bacterium]|nr:rod shape-determining protein RodA [candidate division Zixibacteria bacterium]